MPDNKGMSSSAGCLWLSVACIIFAFSCAQHRTTEMAPAVNPAPATEITLKLEEARSNLAVSKATEERISTELNTLKQSGNADPDDLKNYEIYLSRVQSMVAEHQKIVDEMESALARYHGAEKADGGAEAAMAPEQEAGDLNTLDRKLGDSLSEFDEMLLKEMDEIREKSERRMSTLAEEAASAAGKIGADGGESGAASEGSSAAEGGGEVASEKGRQDSGQSESGGSYGNVPVTEGPVAGGSAGSGTVSGKGSQPSESEQDDDIVARQLREAAEKETDPELKKKLWKEYEDYKKAGSQ